jgi:hypothetical protein
MQSVEAVAELCGSPPAVWSAVRELVGDVWDVQDANVVELRWPELLVHGVVLDGATVCWQTWELSPVGAGSTRVRVVHDELGSAPEPDLDGVLDMLRARVPAQREARET